EDWAIASASVAAWRMTSSMSGRSWSKVVAGFFVNHFGGKPSALRPNEDPPDSVTRVLANRWGTLVMLAMPYRNGNRVRVCRTKNSKGESVNRSIMEVRNRWGSG